VTRALALAQLEKYALEAVALMVAPVVGELPTLTLTSKTARVKYPSLTSMEKKPDMKDLVEAAAPDMVVLAGLEEVSSGCRLQDLSTCSRAPCLRRVCQEPRPTMTPSVQEEALAEASKSSPKVSLVMDSSIFQEVLAPLGAEVEAQAVAWSTTISKVSELT